MSTDNERHEGASANAGNVTVNQSLPRDRLTEVEVYEWREMKPPLEKIIKNVEVRAEFNRWLRKYAGYSAAFITFMIAAKDAIPWLARQVLSILQSIVPPPT